MLKKTDLEKIWDKDIPSGTTIPGLIKIVEPFLNMKMVRENAQAILDKMPKFILQQANRIEHKITPELTYLHDMVDQCVIDMEGVFLSVEENPEDPGTFHLRVSKQPTPQTRMAVKGVKVRATKQLKLEENKNVVV